MNLRNKSVVVTGGAGFIGSHLVDALARYEPEKLVVLDNLFLGKMSNLTQAKKNYPELQFFNHDITDFNAVKNTIEYFKKNG